MKKKPKAQKHTTASKRTPSSKASTASTASPSKWIRIDRPFPLPAYVRDAIQRLSDAGHVAYVVGGSVRDFLLKREAKDHDIATSAGPDELCRLFPEAITVGKAFGVLKIPLPRGDFLEIATFREDLEYEDHRHPVSVRFSSEREDALRRDFTVNAFYFDPKTNRILDMTEGMTDLRARVIRAIGVPQERFKEDALRLLRAVRFASTLDFTIEPATAEAIKSKAKLITHVSAERVCQELTLMWKGPRPALALDMLSRFGLLKHVLPELEAMKGTAQRQLDHPEGDAWNHQLKFLESIAAQTPERSIALAWGGLLHDVGKPIAFRRNAGKHFNGHETDGVKIARDICARLKFSREDGDRVAWLIDDHVKFKDVFGMREATLERFVRQPGFEELLALHRADAAASDGNLANYEFCRSRWEEAQREGPASKLVDGKDLIQLGFHPGPHFTEILRTIEDLALEKKLTTKDEALEYVVKHFVK